MKLYDVKDNTWIRVISDVKVPPAAPLIEEGEKLFFLHLDGMYSVCLDENKQLCHLVAWAEVEPCAA